MPAGVVDVVDVLLLLIVELAEHLLAEHLREADDGIERRAQLMGHVGEELGLVLVGLRELAPLLLDLAEQTRIVNRERGLGGEGAEELDGLRRELAGSFAGDQQRPEDAILAHQRYREERLETRTLEQPAQSARVGPRGIDVGNLDRRTGLGRPPDGALAEAHGVRALEHHLESGCGTGRQRAGGLVVLAYEPAVGAGERDGLVDDRREHGLRVQGRVHHLSDLAERSQLLDRARELAGALVQRLEQAHVVDGDHGLIGESRDERDLALVEGPHFASVDRDLADTLVVPHHRHEERGAYALDVRCGDPVRYSVAIAGAVGNVGKLLGHAFDRYLGGECIPFVDGHGVLAQPLDELRPRALVCDQVEVILLAHLQKGERRIAQPGGVVEDGVEDRRVVGRRAADGAQDVAGRRLALERLGNLFVAGLDFMKQALVLDGDNGLGGEGLHELDFRLGERLDATAGTKNHADRCPAAQQRNAENSAESRDLLQHLQRALVIFRIFEGVLDVYRSPFQEGPAHDDAPIRRPWEHAFKSAHLLGRQVFERFQMKLSRLQSRHRAEFRIAKSGRAVDDGLECRPDIGG